MYIGGGWGASVMARGCMGAWARASPVGSVASSLAVRLDSLYRELIALLDIAGEIWSLILCIYFLGTSKVDPCWIKQNLPREGQECLFFSRAREWLLRCILFRTGHILRWGLFLIDG